MTGKKAGQSLGVSVRIHISANVIGTLDPDLRKALPAEDIRHRQRQQDGLINADPGSILVGRQRELCRTWPNQTEVTVKGRHFLQEDSPDEIGHALADFVRRVRSQ